LRSVTLVIFGSGAAAMTVEARHNNAAATLMALS
jgi:hypothetical protein